MSQFNIADQVVIKGDTTPIWKVESVSLDYIVCVRWDGKQLQREKFPHALLELYKDPGPAITSGRLRAVDEAEAEYRRMCR